MYNLSPYCLNLFTITYKNKCFVFCFQADAKSREIVHLNIVGHILVGHICHLGLIETGSGLRRINNIRCLGVKFRGLIKTHAGLQFILVLSFQKVHT